MGWLGHRLVWPSSGSAMGWTSCRLVCKLSDLAVVWPRHVLDWPLSVLTMCWLYIDWASNGLYCPWEELFWLWDGLSMDWPDHGLGCPFARLTGLDSLWTGWIMGGCSRAGLAIV